MSTANIAHASTVTVKAGDTVSEIAREHNVSAESIKNDNGLDANSTIYPDQQLNVADQNSGSNTYTVVAGDSVSKIAHDKNLDTDKLLALNNLSWSNSTIYVGQTIKLSEDQPQQAAQPAVQTNSSQGQQPQQAQGTTAAADSNVAQANGNQSDISQQAVNLALQYSRMNIPYVWGGKTPSGFDCSGLTHYIYQQLGKEIGANTIAQEQHVTPKAVNQAQPGDLLFWGNPGSTYHVAIYIGNNQYVAAPTEGQNVEVETITPYFMPSFAGSVN